MERDKIIPFYTENFKTLKAKQNLHNFYIPYLISSCVYERMYICLAKIQRNLVTN